MTDSTNLDSSFPSVNSLFKETWQTFTQSILPLFILNILGTVIYLGLAVIAFLIFIFSGAGSFLFKGGFQEVANNLQNIPSSAIVTLSIIAAIFGLMFLIIASAIQTASILILDNKGKLSAGSAFKKSLGFVVPLFLVNILILALFLGAFFAFILPAILFSLLLIFVQFEVILNNQRLFGAIKRSVLLVSRNFGAILIRLIIIVLLYIVIMIIIPNLLDKIGPEVQIYVSIISFLLNSLVGWYMLAYYVVLYKQARVGIEQEKGKGILWMWIVALIGWLMALGIFFVSYKAISSGALNELFKSASSSSGASVRQSISEMSTDAKIHYDRSQELFDKMREVQGSGKSDAEITAEIKKLNDENIIEIRKALQIEPNNPGLWSQLGSAYTWISSTGTLEDGLLAYERAEALDPQNVLYINEVGDMLIKLGKNEEAILHFQKTLRLTDQSGFANLSVARAYANLAIYDTSKEHYEKAIEIFTNENQDGKFDIYILQARKELSNLPK